MTSPGYRDLLVQQLARRCERNPRYSLRSFARDLALSPSYLSEIMRGKHKMTVPMAVKILDRIEFDTETRERFELMVALDNTRSKEERRRLQRRLSAGLSSSKVDADKFSVIASWKDLSALQTPFLKDFVSSHEWLAAKIGETVYWAKDCLTRLSRLGLLREKDGKVTPVFSALSCDSPVPDQAIRNFHKELLYKSLAAIDSYDINQRRYDALILAVKAERLPAAYKRLQTFCAEFDQEFGESEDADKIYAMSMQFFPLVEG